MKIGRLKFMNLICGEFFQNERALRKYYLDKARFVKRNAREYEQYDFRGNLNESEKLMLTFDLRNKIAAINYDLIGVHKVQDTNEIKYIVNNYFGLLEEVMRRTEPLLRQ